MCRRGFTNDRSHAAGVGTIGMTAQKFGPDLRGAVVIAARGERFDLEHLGFATEPLLGEAMRVVVDELQGLQVVAREEGGARLLEERQLLRERGVARLAARESRRE